MSVFFCNGCDRYLDSDIEGYHDDPDQGNICDECECKYHEEEFRKSMDQFRKMAKM